MEPSLKVPDLTIFVSSNSYCTVIIYFFCIVLLPLLFFLFNGSSEVTMKCQEIYKERKEERTRPKMRELHELPNAEMINSGTIRLTSELTKMQCTEIGFQ